MGTGLKRRPSQQGEGDRENGYSGRLLLRMPKSLHADLARLAEERDVSLNQLITSVLGEAVTGEPGESTPSPHAPASPRLTRIALAVNIAVVALAGVLALGLLVVALSDVL